MPKSKFSMWAEMVASGGADVLFESYPNDEELTTRINELLSREDVEGVITTSQVKRDRQRYHELPKRGEMRYEKLASPTKFVIHNKARQLNVYEALAEVLDNIFDNFERNDARPKKLNVDLIAYPPTESSSAELIIRENSGGIPTQRITPLIQLGASDRASGGIGAWGEGFKMAVFALGQEVEVFSTFPKEQPTAIYFPKGWLDPKHPLWTQWGVNIYEIKRNPPPPGSTLIRINHLHQEVVKRLGLGEDSGEYDAEMVCKELAGYFGEVYSEKYHNLRAQNYEVSINITLKAVSNDVEFMEPVETRLRENLAFLPWLRPIQWDKEFSVGLTDENRTAILRMRVYGGLAATENYSPSYAEQLSKPGVEMWGNGRKFSLKGRITDDSAGWGYTYGGRGGTNPTSNSSYRRLTVIALFNADDSRDIPWAAPVKNDYNRRSEFYAEIQITLARVIKLFKDAHALLEFVLLPFSQAWSKYSEEEKLNILFGEVEASTKSIQRFKQSRFGRKILSYKPSTTYKKVNETDNEPTVHSLYHIDSTHIHDIVNAAVASKQSFAQRVQFLKAVFPSLSRQAELEVKMGLALDEEFIHG